MIKSLTVVNYLDESLTLTLKSPELSGLAVKSIEGLGPSEASINTQDAVTRDGSVYNSARLSEKNIVIDLIYLMTPDVETNRLKTYKYFPIKKKVKLIFELDYLSVYIEGYVESNEPDIFSELSSCKISIICPDPYFYAISPNVKIFDLVEDDEPYIGGNIDYTGMIDCGVTIELTASGDVTGLSIMDYNYSIPFSIDDARLESLTGSGIKDGDKIVIDTHVGNKTVKLYRDLDVISIMNCVDLDAKWFNLMPGINTFKLTADTGIEDIEFKLTYRTFYEGV